MEQKKEKQLKKVEDKTGYCLELKMTGCHANPCQPCPECNRSMTTFFTTPDALLKCGTVQCIELGECVCGQQEIDDLDEQDADQIQFS